MTGKDIRMIVLLGLTGICLAILTYHVPQVWILFGFWLIVLATFVGDYRNRQHRS